MLAHSLRRVNTVHHLAVLITPGVSEAMRLVTVVIFLIYFKFSYTEILFTSYLLCFVFIWMIHKLVIARTEVAY